MHGVPGVIPYHDIQRANQALRAPLLEACKRVIDSGRYLYGAELEAFEHELGEWMGVRHVVGVASGTDAVEIALRATGYGNGDEVFTSALTAPATINAIEAAGCQPVLADVSPTTRNVEESDQTVRVHLYGLGTLKNASPPAVEDCAHALGAEIGGRKVGTFGLAGAISFYPTKNLGALGDGGAVVTNDAGAAERARLIRHYGVDNGDVRLRGQNSRLNEIQAALLRVKLHHLDAWNDERRAIARVYNEALHDKVVVPYEPPGHKHVYHCYAIEHPERDRLSKALFDAQAGTMVHYPKAIHQHTRWADLGHPGEFPVAERLARTVLSLPCYPGLTDDERDRVIATVRANT